MAFLDALNLPVTLEQLHIACSDENLDIIVNYMMNQSLLIYREPVPATDETVRMIIRTADLFGRQYLEHKHRNREN